jgi:hypothetical protein
MKRVVMSWLALGLAAPMAGCYKYVPVELESVPLGTSVRAHLNSEGQASLAERALMKKETLQGTLVQRDNGTVYFDVRSSSGSSQLGSNLDLHQRIDVPAEHIIRVDERRIDGLKTGVTVGGIAALSIGAVYLALRGEPSSTTVFPPGPEESMSGVFTLLRLPLMVP